MFKAPPGSPRPALAARQGWLLSYGDMITLLITFFIMMISIRAGDVSRVHAWVDAQLSRAAQELRAMVSTNGTRGLSVQHDSYGVRITIQDENMFDPGSAEPNARLLTYLSWLSETIQNLELLRFRDSPELQAWVAEFRRHGLEWNVEIRVEGHTDDVPLIQGSDYRDNWELSAARAQVVMRILQEYTGLPEAMFAVAGYGEHHPLRANRSAIDRSQNRRVEIIISASLVRRQ
jgi:chemotaxis protein MotB